MKKIINLTVLIALSIVSLSSEAMAIKIEGADKFPKKTQFEVEFEIYEECYPDDYCGLWVHQKILIQAESINEFLQSKLRFYRPEKNTAPSPPLDSTLTIKAIGAISTCNAILSDMTFLRIQLDADGSCSSFGSHE